MLIPHIYHYFLTIGDFLFVLVSGEGKLLLGGLLIRSWAGW